LHNAVAQSMGGVVAMMTASANLDRVLRLVLVATSGGIDMAQLGATDWRPEYLAEQREAPPIWFVDDRTDLTAELATLTIPTLLIYGDADDIAPVAVGEFLQQKLPNATLAVIAGGQHDMGHQRPDEIAALIEAFLAV
ncbi:MAG: alpha/beta hydrolase, partial [Chloroflexi bacterium]|nr:alpha/beta hydrolase [Chloroflexota bacterium]